MSMSSKVNLVLRNAILTFLAPGTSSTNNGLKAHVSPGTSLRAIQEATQKLTKEGALVASRANGKTWYAVPVATPAVA